MAEIKWAAFGQMLDVDSLRKVDEYRDVTRKMTATEYDRLLASWRELGQSDSIIVVRRSDKNTVFVVDGYHRWRAAIDASSKQIRCDILRHDWESLPLADRIEFIKSRNEARRHLSFSEKLENSRSISTNAPNLARRDVAKEAGYDSIRTLQRHEAIESDTVPEVHAALDDNKITMSTATKLSKLPKPDQPAALRAAAAKPKRLPRTPRHAKNGHARAIVVKTCPHCGGTLA